MMMKCRPTRQKASSYAKNPEILSTFLILAEDYNSNPKSYVREHMLTLQGKKRRIITYKSDKKGSQLRFLHHLMKTVISKRYTSSPNSYAYKKSIDILDCVTRHLDSVCFLKTDIHAFFDSVRLEHASLALMRSPVMRKNQAVIETLLRACFYQGHLPIGFVSSPVISDLVLTQVDRKMSKIDSIIYTRYADDFLLSATDANCRDLLEQAENILVESLGRMGLSLNRKKTYYRELLIAGDAIRVLGVNLVRQEGAANRITISNRYLRQVSMLAGELQAQRDNLCDQDAWAMFQRLTGQISFVRHIGAENLDKLAKLFKVKLGYTQPLNVGALREYFKASPVKPENME